MNKQKSLVSGCSKLIPLVIGVVAWFPHLYAAENVGKYDFNYTVSQSERIRVVQVFDDGMQTFFQFKDGDLLPVIFKLTTAGPVASDAKISGQYLVVQGIAGEYVLKLGRTVSRVLYAGGGRFTSQNAKDAIAMGRVSGGQKDAYARVVSEASDGSPSVNKSNPISEVTNTFATPVQGDVVSWGSRSDVVKQLDVFYTISSIKLTENEKKQIRSFATRASSDGNIELTVYADDDHRAGIADARAKSVVSILVGAGLPRDRVRVKFSDSVLPGENGLFKVVTLVSRGNAMPSSTASSALAKGKKGAAYASQDSYGQIATVGGSFGSKEGQNEWVVRKSDGTIQSTLNRWANASVWRLVVRGVPPIYLQGDAVFKRTTFVQAADYVISQIQASGYRIKASAYSDNVLLVTAD